MYLNWAYFEHKENKIDRDKVEVDKKEEDKKEEDYNEVVEKNKDWVDYKVGEYNNYIEIAVVVDYMEDMEFGNLYHNVEEVEFGFDKHLGIEYYFGEAEVELHN